MNILPFASLNDTDVPATGQQGALWGGYVTRCDPDFTWPSTSMQLVLELASAGASNVQVKGKKTASGQTFAAIADFADATAYRFDGVFEYEAAPLAL